jgi:hypothetical protein
VHCPVLPEKCAGLSAESEQGHWIRNRIRRGSYDNTLVVKIACKTLIPPQRSKIDDSAIFPEGGS